MSNKIEKKQCLKEILNEKMNLKIPSYQRPYEWNKSNVYVLLNDIYINYKNNKDINLGVIILNKNNDNLEIVDGQQRLITLSLLLKALDSNYNTKLLDSEIFCLSITEERIIKNFKAINIFIERLINFENVVRQNFFEYLKNSITFYVLETQDTNEAFQLFDGRNSKYKELTPVDLLKAYHLGALPKDFPKEDKKEMLKKWNNNIKSEFKIDSTTNKIEYLYCNILFNIYNWSLNKDIRKFSKNDIYLYKGFKESDEYTYVKYYTNISNSGIKFQINKPFEAGKDFFDMTDYYIEKLDNLINEKKCLYKNENSYNLKFINYIYYGALLFFYDKFGEQVPFFYKNAIDDYIYKYSILHRVKNKQVNFMTINSYVLKSRYNFFFECNNALGVDELLKLETDQIGNNGPNIDEKLGEMRNDLWNELMQ